MVGIRSAAPVRGSVYCRQNRAHCLSWPPPYLRFPARNEGGSTRGYRRTTRACGHTNGRKTLADTVRAAFGSMGLVETDDIVSLAR